jgi:hypothetical protein
VDELSHETQVLDWNLGQFADETLEASLAVQPESVRQRVGQPGEQVGLEINRNCEFGATTFGMPTLNRMTLNRMALS